MIIGIGTDIVDVERISGLWQRQGERFAQRLLAHTEWLEFSDSRFPERFLAKRWAAKEAVSKALGTGIAQGVGFNDIAIGHTEWGQPTVTLSAGALVRAQNLGVQRWHISISDEKNHAVAFVVAERD
ncbi:MAG: holo-ACP synthase [Thiomicrospira sp.]|jgi:holo-[acyl-carrier protein] synthase|nr:holo-ACP synthase [Thiomicrospira sp.]